MSTFDSFEDLFLETFQSFTTPIPRSLFEDEFRRAQKKSLPLDTEDSLPSFLFSALTSVCSSFTRNIPLINEPTDFPNFGAAPAPAFVKSRSVDLHGFNKYGAQVITRRMILNRDPAETYTLKMNVGRATHTPEGKEQIVRPVAISVCREYGYEPRSSSGNEGQIYIDIPAVAGNEEDGIGNGLE